jgi:hypothetical protein
MSLVALNRTDEHKSKLSALKGLPMGVTDLKTGKTVDYLSMSLAAKALNVSVTTIRRHVKNEKPLNGHYLIVKK